MTAIIDPKHLVGGRIGVVKSGPKPSATNTRPGLTLNRKQVDWRAAMQSNEPEIWKPIAGYEGIYEVSDQGRVRSLDRITSHGHRRSSHLLTATLDRTGYWIVPLYWAGTRETRRVHRLVANAFHATVAGKPEVCHSNGDKSDNRAVNLRWGSRRDNMLDVTRHGRNRNALKEACPRGHVLVEPNLVPSMLKRGCRNCLACRRAMSLARKQHRDFDAREADSRYAAIMRDAGARMSVTDG